MTNKRPETSRWFQTGPSAPAELAAATPSRRLARSLSRRQFLQAVLASSLASAARPSRAAPAAGQVGSPSAGLQPYQDRPQIWVRWNNRILLCYRAHPTQKFPYVYPLAGPITGLSLATETGLPWPHHRSLFFGCDRVNGGDYWAGDLSRGHIRSTGPRVGAATKDRVEILDACEWRQPQGTVVMKDQRRVVVKVESDRVHCLDWEIVWTAVGDVRIHKTNHSLFAVRVAPDLAPDGGGQLVNAEGLSGEKATFGKPSAWCACFGKRQRLGGSIIEGIALMDHPSNPWAPCPWFTRDYGFISPTPLNFIERPWELPAGKAVTLRYRVVLHADQPQQAGLPQLYKAWTTS